MHPKDFNSFIKDEYRKEYSFTNIPGIIDSYGIPIINNDKAHYKPLPNQIFGMFDVCHKLNSFGDMTGILKLDYLGTVSKMCLICSKQK